MTKVSSKLLSLLLVIRTGAYSGGGENLTFNGAYCNSGNGLDVDTGVFTCPIGEMRRFEIKLLPP